MRGRFTLGLLLALSFQTFASGERAIIVSRFATGLTKPLFMTTAPGDTDRFFVLEQQRGRVMVLDSSTGAITRTPFLQVPNISQRNEQGLLGMVFDPNFVENGFFYVNYTDEESTTNIVRYQVSTDPNIADPASATTVMTIPQPQANHNGGWIDFGPDGYLYIATGDGGGQSDSGAGHTPRIGNAQDITDNLLGKLLRIDVASDAFPDDANRNYAIPSGNPFVGREGDDEIWAYGLRNPWRNSFDRATGDLYISDVGQRDREEINFQPSTSVGGENYGWRLREGSIATPSVGGPVPAGNVEPIYDYLHDGSPTGGFSVTGGYVYRGPIDALDGHYFFADFVSSQVWSFRYDGQAAQDFQLRSDQIVAEQGVVRSISSFAEDQDGNLYILSLDGDIFRVDDVVNLDELVAAGSLWRYLDDGSDQGTAWREPRYDDSLWDSGRAQLGYGDDDESTVVGFGDDPSNKFPTTYFRREFNVPDAEGIERLLLNVLRDDGAAVYLNGSEVFRTDNLAPDAGFDDLADFNGASAVGGGDEDLFLKAIISGDLLVSGTNVLAVEIHQHSRNSNDLSFDLRLSAMSELILGVVGDLNQNGQLDAQDIDELSRAVTSGDSYEPYDLNSDGQVDGEDRMFWIRDLKKTWIGDSNLDGEFGVADLVIVLAAGEFDDGLPQNSDWAAGDWNGDLEFSSADFVLAFSDGGFLQGPRVVPATVPEPNTLILIVIAAGCVTGALRRSRIPRNGDARDRSTHE